MPSYPGGRFGIIVDGSEFLGYVKKLSGGIIKGELAQHQLGPEHIIKKHITTLSYEDFTCEIGMGMSKGMYEWIQAAWDNAHVTKSGEIHACNFNGESMSIREFRDAQITEVTIPALDGSSKDPAYMTVKFSPEEIKHLPGSGEVVGQVGAKTKKWLCSSFRFELAGLEEACKLVSKIDSFTWKMAVIKDEVGAYRIPTKHPAKLEIPNLKVTISMDDIKPWEDWHREFVIRGKCGEEFEKTGEITFLAGDTEEELGRITLDHVGIISLEAAAQEANKEEIARFTVELYVETMKFFPEVTDA